MEWVKAIAELIGVIAWPGVLIFLLIAFREPIKGLVGRMTSADIAGNRLEFGDELKEAEEKTEEALESAAHERPDRSVQDASSGSTPPAATEGANGSGNVESESGTRRYIPTETEARLHPELVDTLNRALDEINTELARSRAIDKKFNDLLYSSVATSDPSGIVIRSWNKLYESLVSLHEDYRGREPTDVLPYALVVSNLRDILAPPTISALDTMRQLRNQVAHGKGTVTLAESLAYKENADRLVGLVEATRSTIRVLKPSQPTSDGAADAQADS